MFDVVFKCKLCDNYEVTGWHPFWGTKHICWEHRDLMVERHRVWMDKLLEKSYWKKDEVLRKLSNIKEG